MAASALALVNTLFQAGARVQQLFEQHNWAFCFIGGIANFRWGTPRLTNDLDLTLLTGFGNEAAYAVALLAEFDSRVAGAMEFAMQNRVLLLRTPDGFGIDVALGAMPFEARAIERSSNVELVRGATLRTCSAEDLIVHKGRPAVPAAQNRGRALRSNRTRTRCARRTTCARHAPGSQPERRRPAGWECVASGVAGNARSSSPRHRRSFDDCSAGEHRAGPTRGTNGVVGGSRDKTEARTKACRETPHVSIGLDHYGVSHRDAVRTGQLT